MIQVFSAPDLHQAYAIRDLLAKNGIEAHVFNEHINKMPGAFFAATPNAWPSVSISDDTRVSEAKKLIKEYEKTAHVTQQSSSKSLPWECRKCGEKNEGTFEVCWKCGNEQGA